MKLSAKFSTKLHKSPPPLAPKNSDLQPISTKITLAICLSIFAFLFALNALVPLIGDDYVLLNQSNGIQSLIYSYHSWNARIYEMLYGAYIVRLNPYIFDFFNAILGASFVVGLFALLFWDFRRTFNLQDIFLLCVLLFLLCSASAFEAIFLWGDGSANYLWGALGIVLIMLHIKIFLLQNRSAKITRFLESKITIFALLLLSLISASSNETLAVFGIFAYIALFCASKI
ncbi:DUF6056 family protein [Helicobacter sp. 23-1045]